MDIFIIEGAKYKSEYAFWSNIAYGAKIYCASGYAKIEKTFISIQDTLSDTDNVFLCFDQYYNSSSELLAIESLMHYVCLNDIHNVFVLSEFSFETLLLRSDLLFDLFRDNEINIRALKQLISVINKTMCLCSNWDIMDSTKHMAIHNALDASPLYTQSASDEKRISSILSTQLVSYYKISKGEFKQCWYGCTSCCYNKFHHRLCDYTDNRFYPIIQALGAYNYFDLFVEVDKRGLLSYFDSPSKLSSSILVTAAEQNEPTPTTCFSNDNLNS